MRSYGSPTEQGYISHNQGIQGGPMRNFLLTIYQIHNNNRVGSNREPNLPATTDLIYEWLKQRRYTTLLACPNPIKGTGSHLIRHISKLNPYSAVYYPHFHKISVHNTQQVIPSQHQCPIEIWKLPHEIHSTTNSGYSGVCIRFFSM